MLECKNRDTCIKRMYNELFNYVKEDIKIGLTKMDKNIEVRITKNENTKNENTYRILLNKQYPYNPPNRCLINNKEHFYILNNMNSLDKFLFNKISPIKCDKCLKCQSIICTDNWVCSLTMMDIINEYEEILKNIKIIEVWKCIIKIKNKYKIPNDISIEKMVF